MCTAGAGEDFRDTAPTLDRQYIANTYARFDVTFVRGKGCHLYDENGKQYIDMGSGIAVSALGHRDGVWEEAVCGQVRTLAHASNLYYTIPQTVLAEKLCGHSGMKKAFFCNSGAEANECLIKAARKYAADRAGLWVNSPVAGESGGTGAEGGSAAPVICTLEGSFHGRTIATLAASGQDALHRDFGPFPAGFVHVPPNDIQALDTALQGKGVCALLLETIQGEGGIVPLSAEYLRSARRITQERDCLLLVDEVQTGMGRTGKLFGYQHFGILPDGISLAKGLAGGLPMGACLLGEKLADTLVPGSHGSTFGGNPVCAAGAIAVLDRMTEGFLADVAAKGAFLRKELEALPGVTGVSGIGLMLGVEGRRDAREWARALLARGVVTLTAKHKLRLLPPLTIPFAELEKAVAIIKEENRG
ncbi:MAG: aspartate aminotransferase family protein [Clostridia bacterium]|nr:aspartate aminotransferase family protein [Clostridia bacterium]